MHLHYTHVCQVKICPIKGARTTRAIKEPTILSESKGIWRLHRKRRLKRNLFFLSMTVSVDPASLTYFFIHLVSFSWSLYVCTGQVIVNQLWKSHGETPGNRLQKVGFPIGWIVMVKCPKFEGHLVATHTTYAAHCMCWSKIPCRWIKKKIVRIMCIYIYIRVIYIYTVNK